MGCGDGRCVDGGRLAPVRRSGLAAVAADPCRVSIVQVSQCVLERQLTGEGGADARRWARRGRRRGRYWSDVCFGKRAKWVLSSRAWDLAAAEVCRMEVQETAGAEVVWEDAGGCSRAAAVDSGVGGCKDRGAAGGEGAVVSALECTMGRTRQAGLSKKGQ